MNQKGMTLIETIISVVLSTIIVTLIVTLFLTQQKGYIRDEHTATIQENGHQALEELVVKIRQAGYMLPSLTSYPKIKPYNNTSTPDSIALYGNFANFTTKFWLTSQVGDWYAFVYNNSNFKYTYRMWLWTRMRDGTKSEVHIIESYGTMTYMGKNLIYFVFPSGETFHNVYKAESTNVIVSTFSKHLYKIQTVEAGHPSMYLFKNNYNVGEEVVRDIENMQFTYKLTTGSTVDLPTDLTKVDEVNVTITARAPTIDRAYKKQVPSSDGYRRKVFSSSVKMYNLVF